MISAVAIADEDGIAYPQDYGTWFHHRTTVNLPGHAPEKKIGIQHLYANPLALEDLKTETYRAGTMFIVDRFQQVDGENSTLRQGNRKVVA